mmetsp:Transcript_37597/g.67033  ORF Transcript_37597/g.67033 Transcript_37597/m.67033 type:complete len:95 (+) Transcript_37597:1371-1655(+)
MVEPLQRVLLMDSIQKTYRSQLRTPVQMSSVACLLFHPSDPNMPCTPPIALSIKSSVFPLPDGSCLHELPDESRSCRIISLIKMPSLARYLASI